MKRLDRLRPGDDAAPVIEGVSEPSAFPSAYLTGANLATDPGPLPPGLALTVMESNRKLLPQEAWVVLFGGHGVGKTYVAQAATIEVATAGLLVVYLDFEENERDFRRRLQATYAEPGRMGFPSDPTIVDRIGYLAPDGPIDLRDHMPPEGTALLVVNGYDGALTKHDCDPNVSADIQRFRDSVIDPIRRELPDLCVLTVDHPPHGENRPRGSGRKSELCDLMLELQQGDSVSKLVNRKDRHGFTGVRRGRPVADVRMFFDPDGTASIEVHSEAQSFTDDGQFRPTVLMERVSFYLEELTDPASQRAVRRDVQGKERGIIQALSILVSEGYASLERDGYRHVKRYTEASDPLLQGDAP